VLLMQPTPTRSVRSFDLGIGRRFFVAFFCVVVCQGLVGFSLADTGVIQSETPYFSPMPQQVPLLPDGMVAAPEVPTEGFVASPYAEVLPVHSWPRWFAGASGLVMTRTLPAGHSVSALPGSGVVLATNNAAATWPGGVDLHFGRWLGSRHEHAIETIYWGLYNIGGSATATDPAGRLVAIPQAPGVQVDGVPAGSFLTNAAQQSISRNDLVNNIEINWLFAPNGRPEFLDEDDRRISFMWLAGFRFFELQDILTLTSVAAVPPPGASSDQLSLKIATNNNLYGGQLGTKFDWRFFPHVRLSIVPKFLLAGNAVTNTSTLASGSGVNATFPGGSPVNVHSTAGTFAYVGSVDTGVAWDITPRWSLSMGYRVVGVGNVALSDQSWPNSITSPASLSVLNTAGSTIVHGGFAGFEGRY
jgi:hypothetical protein